MLAAAGLTGCDRQLTVAEDFPEPVIEPLPIDVGIRYTDELAAYRYREKAPGEPEWDIELGSASVAMFESVFHRLFRSAVQVVGDDPGAGPEIIIEPEITAFEYALPAHSGTDQYSVWIRYTLNVYRPGGVLLTAWKVSAYGQSGSSSLRPARSMEQATIQAIRDAAAAISLGFTKESAIRDTLLPDAPAPDAPEEKPDDTG